jgi:hypothetical protein
MYSGAPRVLISLTLVISGSLSPFVSKAEPLDCDLIETREVVFSDPLVADTIVVEIAGRLCDEATLSVTIQDAVGRVLYRHTAALGDGFRRVVSRADAQSVLRSSLNGFGPTSALPGWGGGFDVMEPVDTMHPIERSEYERIKEKGWVSYSYQVGYEGRVVVVYDRDQKRVREVIRGSD